MGHTTRAFDAVWAILADPNLTNDQRFQATMALAELEKVEEARKTRILRKQNSRAREKKAKKVDKDYGL